MYSCHIYEKHVLPIPRVYTYIGSWIAHIERQFNSHSLSRPISLLEYMLAYTSPYSYITYSYRVKCSFTGHTSIPLLLLLASYHNLVFSNTAPFSFKFLTQLHSGTSTLAAVNIPRHGTIEYALPTACITS